MAIKFSDQMIETLILEKKPLPQNYLLHVRLKDKHGHKESELDLIRSAEGGRFRLILRQSNFNTLDFSIILAVCSSASSRFFRLRRYNGKSHEHKNLIEGNTFYDFHMHTASERYQEIGRDEDSFAEPTNRYGDFQGALDCMLKDCCFELPKTTKTKGLTLFPEDLS